MTDSLTLAFSELEFVLTTRQPLSAGARRGLGLDDADEHRPVLARAGLASLMARGLCETVESGDQAPGVRVQPPLSALVTALSDGRVQTTAVAWCGERRGLVHLFSGGGARVALFPYRNGLYTVEALNAGEPQSAPLVRFLSRHLEPGSESALAVRSVSGDGAVVFALAVDGAGRWSASDTYENPDHTAPTTRDRALARMAELFDSVPAGSR